MSPARRGPRPPADEWIFGIHPVEAVLESDRSVSLVYRARESTDRRLTPVVKRAKERGIAVVRVPRQRLDRLAGGGNHQGIAACVSPVELLGLEAWLDATTARAGARLLLVLDGVTDEGNAGALVRSAAALGADGVLLAARGGARPGAGLARTASGALERVPIVAAPSVRGALDRLESAGFRRLGAVVDGGEAPAPEDRRGDRALVLGAEDRGVGREARAALDRRLTIPTRAGMPSLNVAAAGAILLARLIDLDRDLDRPGESGRS